MSVDPIRRGPAPLAPEPPFDAHVAPRSTRRDWAPPVAVATGALSGVAGLGERVFGRAPGSLDLSVRLWTLAHHTPTLLLAFAWISRLGAPGCSLLLAAAVALWLLRARARYAAAVVLAAPALAIVLFNVLKLIVHRTRPAGGLLLREVTFSFPSGHAAVSAAAYATLAWVLAREHRIPRAAAVTLAVLGPLLVGASRVYLDVHWTTDVLAGWCTGAAVAALAIGAYEHHRRRRPA